MKKTIFRVVKMQFFNWCSTFPFQWLCLQLQSMAKVINLTWNVSYRFSNDSPFNQVN